MIGDVSAGHDPVRNEGRLGQRGRFGRTDLRCAVNGPTSAAAQRLIRAAHGLSRQIELLARSGHSVMHEVLGPHAVAAPWVQYPAKMVQDPYTRADYFFHSHGPSPSHPDERGHFHVFVRGLSACQSHLLAIAIDPYGMPIRLFTTNRWVTGENWMFAEELLTHADHYSLVAPDSSEVLNCWITHCVRLFQPQLRWLTYRRDARLHTLAAGRGVERVFEDRRVEILSECQVSVGQQVAALQAALDA